jgi:hypothetical protein
MTNQAVTCWLEGGSLFYSPSVCGKVEREGTLRKEVPLAFVSAVSKIQGGSKGMYGLRLQHASRNFEFEMSDVCQRDLWHEALSAALVMSP